MKLPIILLLISLALTLFAKVYPFFIFDPPITKFIQQSSPPWFNELMKIVTISGNLAVGSLITGLVVVSLLSFSKVTESLFIMVSTASAEIISLVVKTAVSRPRPDLTSFDSFPSGHVLFAMGLYGSLLYLIFTKLKKGKLKKVIVSLLILMLILMGLSRIYLGAHWFSDVLGAYLIGGVLLYLMAHLYKLTTDHDQALRH